MLTFACVSGFSLCGELDTALHDLLDRLQDILPMSREVRCVVLFSRMPVGLAPYLSSYQNLSTYRSYTPALSVYLFVSMCMCIHLSLYLLSIPLSIYEYCHPA